MSLKSTFPAKRLCLVRLETRQTRQSLIGDSIDTYANPKTSFKTDTNDDDEALTLFAKIVSESHRRIAGKSLLAHEKDKWGEVARVLVAELERASNRAGSISSVPAFLAEHLRRRFNQPERKDNETESRKRIADNSQRAEPQQEEKRLTQQEIVDFAATVRDLIADGQSPDQVAEQFAPSLHDDDWNLIRQAATASEMDSPR